MSVTIILAHKSVKYDAQTGAVIIPDIKTCFAWLQKIKNVANDSSQSLTVAVLDSAAAQMLETLRGQFGIEFCESDVRTELTKRWHCPIPMQLTVEAIEILGLLDIAAPRSQDAIGTILNRVYNTDIFSFSSLSSVDEAALLNLLACGHSYSSIASSVKAVLTIRLLEWGACGSRVAETLTEKPENASWYIVLFILRNYPLTVKREVRETLEHVFDAQPVININILTEVPLEPKHVPPSIKLPLETALKPHLVVLPLSNYLKVVSGILSAELQVLVERVWDKPGTIDLITARAVFATLEASNTTPILEQLELHWSIVDSLNITIEEITKEKRPDQAFAELSKFYVKRYLTVKESYGNNAQVLEQLLKWNEEYGEWLVRNYHRLKVAQEPIFAADQLRNCLRTLLENGKIPILWVIDGLSWLAFISLCRVAANSGLFLSSEPKACLAPIPTLTEIGMTTLISGESPGTLIYKHPNPNKWRTVREEYFQQYYPNSNIGRADNPTQINRMLTMSAPLYLLQSLMVDKYVHDRDLDEELFKRSLDTYFEVQCQALVRLVGEASHLREQHRNLVVVVVTDHGYTDLLRQGVAHLPSELDTEFNSVTVEDPHHCVIEITLPPEKSEKGRILRKLLDKDWYVIEGDSFNLPKKPTWLIPKKQQRTRGGSLRVHGRPSLEETIVPLAEFSFCRQEPLRLNVAIQGKLIKDSESLVDVQLTNYESWTINDVIIDNPVLGLEVHIPKINPNAVTTISTLVRPKQSGNLKLLLRIASSGGPFQLVEIGVLVEQSDEERLLGEDRVAKFFDDEEL